MQKAYCSVAEVRYKTYEASEALGTLSAHISEDLCLLHSRQKQKFLPSDLPKEGVDDSEKSPKGIRVLIRIPTSAYKATRI